MVAARTVLMLFPLLLLTAPLADAQQAASYLNIAPVSPSFGPGPTSDRRVSTERRLTYWAEGGGAGAAVLGILGILFAARACADLDLRGSSDNCVGPMLGSALLGAGLGFTIGALIGARVPKQ